MIEELIILSSQRSDNEESIVHSGGCGLKPTVRSSAVKVGFFFLSMIMEDKERRAK